MAIAAMKATTRREIVDLLGDKKQIKLGHNTWAKPVPGGFEIVYHQTAIVTYDMIHGIAVFDNGGWSSVTTSGRMHLFLMAFLTENGVSRFGIDGRAAAGVGRNMGAIVIEDTTGEKRELDHKIAIDLATGRFVG